MERGIEDAERIRRDRIEEPKEEGWRKDRVFLSVTNPEEEVREEYTYRATSMGSRYANPL